MIIKQLSVFLENKTGRINDVVHTLGANGINMHAFSMAETADFGILRLIVSDVAEQFHNYLPELPLPILLLSLDHKVDAALLYQFP